MRVRFPLLFCLIATCMAAGCASEQTAAAKGEPGVIALRNMTGEPLASLTITEDRDPAQGPIRLGSIAPVNPSLTYVFVRPRDAKPLPPRVRVIWRGSAGPQRMATVSVDDVLKRAIGGPNEAIVFEIDANQQVKVSLELVVH